MHIKLKFHIRYYLQDNNLHKIHFMEVNGRLGIIKIIMRCLSLLGARINNKLILLTLKMQQTQKCLPLF